MVGFFNAYELSGDQRYLRASNDCWKYIQHSIIDNQYGEWFWGVDENGKIYREEKIGPWKCPYHNARACFEIANRIKNPRS